MKKIGSYRRLANILSRLEFGVLSASDQDILSATNATKIEKRVRGIIADHLEAREADANITIPNDAADRRRLFELIARSRSTIPKEIRMAYSASRPISDDQVSTLLRKLLRLGFLGKREQK